MKTTVDFLKVIADQNRLLILFILKKQPLCVCDLQKMIPLTQGALSTQLKNLSVNGLLDSHKQGKWIFYKLSKSMKLSYSQMLSQLFKEIEDSIFVKEALSKSTISKNCKTN
jgi:DNA-binding transcriptional ArsR family regulator